MDLCVMARLNVYLPDDLAAQAKAAGLNLSAVTQEAVKRPWPSARRIPGCPLSGRQWPTTSRTTAPSRRSTPRATNRLPEMADVVVDASALVDLLLANELGDVVP